MSVNRKRGVNSQNNQSFGKKKAKVSLEFRDEKQVSNQTKQKQSRLDDFYAKDPSSVNVVSSTSTCSIQTSTKSKLKVSESKSAKNCHSNDDKSKQRSKIFPEKTLQQNSQTEKQVDSIASVGSDIKKATKVSNEEESDKHGENVHQISDSESESSADTQPVEAKKKPLDFFKPSAHHKSPRKKQSTSMSPMAWSARDTEAYRKGYPNKKDNVSLNDNWRFYNNQIESKPRGTFIDKMHVHWFGNYSLLEEHHGYIQWLFPIREMGMNWQSQELQPHEAKRICSDHKARQRVLKSYELMLHFWGMHLKDGTTGRIARGDNWRERFRNLNRSSHNYLRITRMLKSLGELGYEHFKLPFLKFILREAVVEKTLSNAKRSCCHYWIHTLRNEEELKQIQEDADDIIQGKSDDIKFTPPKRLLGNCWLQAMMSQFFSPSCNDDGTYSSKQCHKKRCWCSDKHGRVAKLSGGLHDDGTFFGIKALTLHC